MKVVKLGNQPTDMDKEILREIAGKRIEICFIQGIYTQEFYSLLQEMCGGGGQFKSLLVFNMDLQDYEKDTIKQIYLATRNSYALFFSPYESIKNPLLFKLLEVNLEKFMIEYAYKNRLIEKQTRNFMHSFGDNVAKQDFFVDRVLYNLSKKWEIIGIKSQNKLLDLQLIFPKLIHIGLLNECNISCPLCPWFGPHKQTQTTNYFKIRQQLEKTKVYEILDYTRLGNSRVIFSGPGEPLLDSHLLDYVKYAKQIGIKHIGIATNAIFLNKQNFLDLSDAGVDFFDVVILFAKKVYEQYQDDFIVNHRKVLRDTMVSCNNPKIKIRLNISCYAKEFLTEALELFIDIRGHSKIECQFALYTKYDTIKSWEEYQANNPRHTCSAPFASLYIFPDGSVGFCDRQRGWLGREDVETFRLDNIYNQSLEQIWYNQIHKQILQKHLDLCFDDPCLKICKTCDSWWNETNQ